jgi:hypothetical protein
MGIFLYESRMGSKIQPSKLHLYTDCTSEYCTQEYDFFLPFGTCTEWSF